MPRVTPKEDTSHGGKAQKGFDKGKGGKGKDGKGKNNFSSQLKKNAAGNTVFMGTCFSCNCTGHTGKFCYLQNKAQGVNTTCATCGVWGHKPEYCPKTALAEVSIEQPRGPGWGQQNDAPPPPQGPLDQVTSLGNPIDLCSVDQAI